MKSKIGIMANIRYFISALCLGTMILPAVCASVCAASNAERNESGVYQKKNTFLGTVLATRANYQKWVERNAADASVKFGKWYVSNGIHPSYKKVLTAINPFTKPVDLKDTFVRRPIWNTPDIKDSTIFNLHRYNFKIWDSIVFYLTRDITAESPVQKRVAVGLRRYFCMAQRQGDRFHKERRC